MGTHIPTLAFPWHCFLNDLDRRMRARKFKPDAVNIAKTPKVELQPICIFGSDDLMPRNRAIPRSGIVHVCVHDSFHIGPDAIVAEESEWLRCEMSRKHKSLLSTKKETKT